jgi:hypothetical protein
VSFNALPEMNSKVRKVPVKVHMDKGDPANVKPIMYLVSNEIVQLKK